MIVRFLSIFLSQAPAGAIGTWRDLANVGEKRQNTYTPLPDRLVEEYRRHCDVKIAYRSCDVRGSV